VAYVAIVFGCGAARTNCSAALLLALVSRRSRLPSPQRFRILALDSLDSAGTRGASGEIHIAFRRLRVTPYVAPSVSSATYGDDTASTSLCRLFHFKKFCYPGVIQTVFNTVVEPKFLT
jgi:hypothetical protein